MNIRPWNLGARDNLNLYVFVGVLVVVGAVFGALLVNALTLEQQQDLAGELGRYLTSAGQPDKLHAGEAFRDSFLLYAKWLALIWLLGLSVIGLPVVLVLDFLKGVLLGFAVGLIVRHLAWKGVLVALAAVAPQNLLVVPAFVMASVSAARFASFVARERLFRKKGQLMPPFVAHTAVAAMMLALVSCAALFEAYVSPLLLERVSGIAAQAEWSAIFARF
ncbi:stage II sporulation protein M [Cohnella nanjingensis]|uniref:stage II sporulation protein M n=1 Tax=Cohnella nanjingensis TaxID=1387779 RepID=UPI0028A7AFBD|nr:stage II sporulation protein M [Cohnella nanjingensis]